MPIKFFAVPALDPGEAETELNRFMRGHRVVTNTRELAVGSGGPVWCVAVEYIDAPVAAGAGAGGDANARRSKVDYREVLPPAEFARFSKLRDLRKKMAEEEAVPVYAVFTNEQLALIAQKQPKTAAALQEVDGVGEGKAKKYGDRVLAVLASMEATPAP